MTSWPRRLDRWFGEPAPPERLAAFRMLLGAFTLCYLLIRLPVFLELADGRPSRFEPVGVLSPLAAPLPGGLVQLMVAAAVISAAAFTVGWRYRLSGPALALLMLTLGSYRNSWGQLLHFENLLVLHLLVVGLSPAASVWSRDARRSERPPASGVFGWPLRLAASITVSSYALTGLAKLRYGGLEWMLGDTLQNHVAFTATRLELLGGTPSPLATSLVDQAWLFPPIGVATVVIELGAPLALLVPSLRRWWVISAWLLHVGILGLMLIVFPYPLVGLAFAPLYRLERLVPARWTESGSRPPSAPAELRNDRTDQL